MITEWFEPGNEQHAAWFTAAQQGDVSRLRCLLDSGTDVNTRGDFGMTALMLAVGCRHLEATETLILAGADIHAECGPKWTALTWAAIVAKGWEFDAPPWPTSLCQPDRRFLDLLLSDGARLSLREAVLMEDLEIATRLCNEDPALDVNAEADYRFHEPYLMMAAELGSLTMIDFLLERGADIEGRDDLGRTPLIVAANAGRTSAVDLLLDRGADVNAGWPSQSPLANAERCGHLDTAALLLSRGAKRRIRDAVERDDIVLLRALIASGCDPNEPYTIGDDVPSILSAAEGLDPTEPEWPIGNGRLKEVRPVMHAVIRGSAELVRFLVELGVPIDIQGWDLHSVLAEAADRGHTNIVRLLLEHGADPDAVGLDRVTALDCAIRGNHLEIVHLLERSRRNAANDVDAGHHLK